MYTEGMLVLDNVMMGVINIEPKEILVVGLQKAAVPDFGENAS